MDEKLNLIKLIKHNSWREQVDPVYQSIGIVLFLQLLYFINRERKPYYFGLTPQSMIIKSQLTKGILISLYIFIAVAAFGKLAQDLYHVLVRC